VRVEPLSPKNDNLYTDLSDGQWQFLEVLTPTFKPGGQSRSTDVHEIVVDAIFCLMRAGCA
jgi:transposase